MEDNVAIPIIKQIYGPALVGIAKLKEFDLESIKLLVARIKLEISNFHTQTVIFGCGGIGSHLASALPRNLLNQNYTLVDFDKIEQRNLERQKFGTTFAGQFKAMALKEDIEYYVEQKSISASITDYREPSLVSILSSDSAMSRLYSVMNCYSSWYIHTANNANCSTSFLIEAKSKRHLLGYVMYLLGMHFTIDSQPAETNRGCAERPIEQQTSMANFNAAVGAIRLLQVIEKNNLITYNQFPGFYEDDWTIGCHEHRNIDMVNSTLNSIGAIAHQALIGPIIDDLRNELESF